MYTVLLDPFFQLQCSLLNSRFFIKNDHFTKTEIETAMRSVKTPPVTSRSDKILPISFSALLSKSGHITNFAVVVIMIAFLDVLCEQVGIEAVYLVWSPTLFVLSIDNNCFQAAWIRSICSTPVQEFSN